MAMKACLSMCWMMDEHVGTCESSYLLNSFATPPQWTSPTLQSTSRYLQILLIIAECSTYYIKNITTDLLS